MVQVSLNVSIMHLTAGGFFTVREQERQRRSAVTQPLPFSAVKKRAGMVKKQNAISNAYSVLCE
jgi:hypothetical protein